MLKEKKFSAVSSFKDLIAQGGSAVVVQYHGITVEQISALRKKVREHNSQFFVMKNTLAKIAIKDSALEGLTEYFVGPTAVAVTQDAVGMAKVLMDFKKEHDALKLIGAIVDGKKITPKDIEVLSKMPSMNELRAKIISILQTPARSIASILVAPARNIARMCSAYSSSGQ